MYSLLLPLLLIPTLASCVIFCLKSFSSHTIKRATFILSLIPLVLLSANFSHSFEPSISWSWIARLPVNLAFKIDSLSLVFIFLTSLIIPISLISTPSKTIRSPHVFYGLILLLQSLLNAFFTASDLVVFILFWEAMLLPLYFMIGFWSPHKELPNSETTPSPLKGAMRFFIYMIAGSCLLIVAAFALYFSGSHTFDMAALSRGAENMPNAKWILAIFLLAFAVKTPLFPFHAWLPDAYALSNTAVTILLSAILSKAGIYGIVRVARGFFPHLMDQYSSILFLMALIGVFYGAFAAWRQNEAKRVIAYSSFSHVNFILAALFIGGIVATSGSLLQAINHGITIAALFLVVEWLQERVGDTKIDQLGGLAKQMPRLCWVTLFFVLASCALPGTNNFVGEFIIFFGIFKVNPFFAIALAFSIIFSVVYMLRFMKLVYFGKRQESENSYVDIGLKNLGVALPLVILILWIGIYPKPILQPIQQSLTNQTAFLEKLK